MLAPLDGLLAVALEQAVAAPFASRLLADAGARVIKVERPEGDFARGYDVAANGLSSYFAWLNRGKESIALDLKDDADRDLLDGIVARADVFIQNLAVGAAGRLGFGADRLRERDPRLVVCEISGYGTEGPYAAMKAYDLLVQAESGVVAVSGAPGPYGRVGVSLADIATGQAAALAVSQALLRQARDGTGAHLETSLFATMAEWMTVPLLHHDYLGRAPERVGLAHPSIAPYGGFDTADGDTILISVQSDREWRVLCTDLLERPELGDDERFATNEDRVANRGETDAVVAEGFARLDSAEIRSRLAASRIAFGVVNDVAGLSAHPQLRRVTVPHELGSFELPAPAVNADWETMMPVPALDQHGAAIRAEFGQ
ncbi:MAG: CaiB/BaiF CoA-transferase family protein [Acidimicrobiales bacterium]